MAHDLSKKTERSKLTPRREPYWVRVEIGLYLGFRVMGDNVGTWIARRQEGNKKTYQALGHSTNLSAKTTAAVGRRNPWADAAAEPLETSGNWLKILQVVLIHATGAGASWRAASTSAISAETHGGA